MTVTILATGPSLRNYVPSPEDGIVLAINRAIDYHPCDWWCTGELADPSTWAEHLRDQPRPRIGIATDSDQLQHVRAPYQVADLGKYWPIDGSRRRFTGPMALAWALEAWPGEQVRCWGMDLAGDSYCSGDPVIPPRRMSRTMQIREARIFAGVSSQEMSETQRIRAQHGAEERWRLERQAVDAVLARWPGRVEFCGR